MKLLKRYGIIESSIRREKQNNNSNRKHLILMSINYERGLE